MVKAHQSSAAKDSEVNQHIGISSGGRTTKIHAVADGLGNPLYIKLTAGQIHDSTQAIEILSQLSIKGSSILADKAYGTKKDILWNVFSISLNSSAE